MLQNVINTFTQVAENPHCNFYGNVEVGKDILIKDLQRSYSAVILVNEYSNMFNSPNTNNIDNYMSFSPNMY